MLETAQAAAKEANWHPMSRTGTINPFFFYNSFSELKQHIFLIFLLYFSFSSQAKT
jgi:hypothetical protein